MKLIKLFFKLIKGIWAIIKYLLLKIIDKLINVAITILIIVIVYRFLMHIIM